MIARDIAYELAGAKDRNLAVDVLIHATGIAKFGPESLRDYGSGIRQADYLLRT